jgi:acyl-CoA thioester hydrolase
VIPSLDEVQQLPRLLELTVPAEYEDYNGHMKITHHLGLHDDAGPAFFALLGLDETYFTERRNGIVDLEHHIRYLGEVFAGDRVAVHSRALARSAKTMHGIWFLLNLTRGQVANTLEFVSVHIDLDERRASPFPPDVAELLDRLIADHRGLSWDPPVGGFIGVG